ncbi:ras-related protein Rab-34-like, partial [Notechis scutatus]|uniref:Ras-related protein Rab-34-like n=1 Tax=Notechis scutatus TaxID=8663 RepID=A0A6J1W2H9_9SAUR
IIIVFDLTDVASLDHTRQWLADALKENDPSSVLLFLVGTKKDLSTPAQYKLIEQDARKVAKEMQAEYWAVSSLTGKQHLDHPSVSAEPGGPWSLWKGWQVTFVVIYLSIYLSIYL